MGRWIIAVLTLGIGLLADESAARSASVFNNRVTGLRQYWGYPYYQSWGGCHHPYWSYKSSYYPEQYGGDGSYYGMGYSGYSGSNWYGSYWYW